MKQSFKILYFLQVILRVVSPLKSESIQLQRNENYFITSKNSLIFESDNKNLSEISSIDYKFIDDAFTIKAFDNGKLFKLVFLSSLQFMRTTYCVCQLLQTEFLNFISCIDGIFIFQSNYTIQHHKNSKKYKIDISLRVQENCSEMFVDYENQVIACCFTQEGLKIYKFSLKSQSIIVWQDESSQNLETCSIKIHNFQTNSFLAFYKCKNWQLINITKNQISIILNQEIGLQTQSFDFTKIQKLSEIFICQDHLYLIQDENYYMFSILENSFTFLDNYVTTMEIKQIVFFEPYCAIKFIILSSNIKKDPFIQFNNITKEILINSNSDVYEINSFLLLKDDKNIKLILCKFFNQTYELHSTKLQFIKHTLKIDNIQVKVLDIFFQMDESQSQAAFYKFNGMPKFIQPHKKFVFEIFKFNIFTKTEDEMTINQVINAKDLNSQAESHNVFINNKCQLLTSVQFEKNQLGFPLFFELQLQTQEIIYDISDEQDLYNYLPFEIKKQAFSKIFYIGVSNFKVENLIIYITQENEQVINFHSSKQVYQEHIENQQVFNFKNIIVLLNFKIKQLKRVIFINSSPSYEEVQVFEKEIISATYCLDQLIIYFVDKTYCILNVQAFQFIYLNQQFKEFGVPLCYFSKNYQQLIQFEKILVCLLNNVYSIVQIENIEIFQVSIQPSGFLIQAIHKDLDKIMFYNVDGQSIVQFKEFVFLENSLVRPLIYQSIKNYLSIASITNSKKSILILKTDNKITIIGNKYCNNFNFALQTGILIYQDQSQKFQIFSFEQYNLSVNIIPYQKNYFIEQKVNFQITLQQSNQTYIKQSTLNIITLNFCHYIIKKQNIAYLDYDSRIVINDFFEGQIEKIISSDENLLSISGPFHSEIKLDVCQNTQMQNNNYCFSEYDQILKSTEQYFKLRCIPKFQYCLITSIGDANIITYYHFINNSKILTVKKQEQSFFFHLFQIDNENRIINEISYQQIIELDNLSQSITIENKNMIFFIIEKQQIVLQYILQLYDQNYLIYSVKEDILDICSIQNNNNFYLFLQYTINYQEFNQYYYQDIQCLFVSFQNNKRQIVSSFIFGNQFISFLLENNLRYLNFYSCQIKFTFCQTSHQQIQFNILFIPDITNSFSAELQFNYNSQTTEKSFKVIRVYRNPVQGSLNMYYFDCSYMIISSQQNLYFYNLTINSSFYDYTSLLEKQNFKLQKINTTHYIYDDIQTQYLAEIGFKLKASQHLKTKQDKISLIAQNDVSKVDIEIVFIDKQQNGEKLQNFIIGFSLFLLGVLFIFLLRRRIIKKQKSVQAIFNSFSQNVQ